MYRYHPMRPRPPGTFRILAFRPFFSIHCSLPTPARCTSAPGPIHAPANAAVSVPGAPYISFLI